MSPSLVQSLQNIFFRPISILITTSVASIYIAVAVYFLNYKLVIDTLIGHYPLNYKFSILLALLEGMFTSFTTFNIVFLIISAILVGVNVVMMIKTFSKLKRQGSITFTAGGATLLGITFGGCGSCGISILALLGISSAISSLPFHGLELHFLTVLMLSGSLLYMIKRYHEKISCTIPIKSNKIKNIQ